MTWGEVGGGLPRVRRARLLGGWEPRRSLSGSDIHGHDPQGRTPASPGFPRQRPSDRECSSFPALCAPPARPVCERDPRPLPELPKRATAGSHFAPRPPGLPSQPWLSVETALPQSAFPGCLALPLKPGPAALLRAFSAASPPGCLVSPGKRDAREAPGSFPGPPGQIWLAVFCASPVRARPPRKEPPPPSQWGNRGGEGPFQRGRAGILGWPWQWPARVFPLLRGVRRARQPAACQPRRLPLSPGTEMTNGAVLSIQFISLLLPARSITINHKEAQLAGVNLGLFLYVSVYI